MKKGFLRFLSISLSLIMLVGMLSFAGAAESVASGECGDNLTWTLDDDGTLTISGTGDMWDFDYEETPWYDFYESITSVIIGNGVTSIGSYAFSNCYGIANITIPDGITSIGNSALAWCNGLTSLTIPDSVTSIGDDAFYDHSDLANITVSSGNTVYHSAGNCLIETSSKTLICGCYNGVIPADGSVTSIGNGAFSGGRLANITIPDSVTSIGDSAFYGCTEPTSLTIPDSVTNIGGWAFYGCAGLNSISLGCSVTSIETYAFYYCENISDVFYSGDEDSWNEIDFGDGNDYLLNANIHFCKHLNAIEKEEIPATCTEDGYEAGVCCADCGKYISGGNIIPAYGHTDENEDGVCDECGNTMDLVIHCGDTLDVEITAGEITKIKFIPENTGEYIFESHSEEDTYGYIYDAIGEEIYSDDDSGEGCNFKLEYSLTAGETYYFGVKLYSDDEGIITVTLKKSCYEHIDADGDGFCDSCNADMVVASGECGDNLTWTLDTNGILAISGTGDMWDFEDLDCSPWFSYREDIKEIILSDEVTSLGNCAFYNCWQVSAITIPESVNDIGNFVFSSCSMLKTVEIPENVTAIGNGAFFACYELSDVIYGGTKEDWDKIDIGEDNEALLAADIYYNGESELPCEHEGGTATCTEKAVCILCGEEYGEVNPDNHISFMLIHEDRAFCDTDGLQVFKCTDCDYTYETVIAATGHTDKNDDGFCDECGFDMNPDPTKECNHICHKTSGISKFFYKIALFFWKLFGTHKYCECGMAHY